MLKRVRVYESPTLYVPTVIDHSKSFKVQLKKKISAKRIKKTLRKSFL